MARPKRVRTAVNQVDVRFQPLQPKQRELWELLTTDHYRDAVDANGETYRKPEKTVIGFGGALGGGKSMSGRNILLKLALEVSPVKILVLRRIYREILDSHINEILREHQWIEAQGYWLVTEKTIALPNGSMIVFGHCEHERDVRHYDSSEYDYIFIDEAGDWTEYMITHLRGRNRRSAGSPVKVPKMLLTFNPGGVGHKYIKRVFVARQYQHNEDPADFAFIRSFVWDNAHHVRDELDRDGIQQREYYGGGIKTTRDKIHAVWNDERRRNYFLTRSSYGAKLLQLPQHEREAKLFGSFDTFVGQFFDRFSEPIHVIKPFKIDPSWPVLAGLDYGNRTSLEVITRDADGNIYVIGERVFSRISVRESPHIQPDLLDAAGKARAIKRFLSAENADYWEEIGLARDGTVFPALRNLIIMADTNMWVPAGADVGSDLVPAQVFTDAGLTLVKVSKNSEKHARYRFVSNDVMQSLLSYERDAEGKITRPPRIFFFEGRTDSIVRTMPELMVDPANPEDFMDGADDHDYDALKYAVMSVYRASVRETDDTEYVPANRTAYVPPIAAVDRSTSPDYTRF